MNEASPSRLPDVARLSLEAGRHDPVGFAASLGGAFEEHGFAIVADHGIAPATIAAADAAARALFALPDAEKRRWRDPAGGGQRGYTPFGVEGAKGAGAVDAKEFWHVGREREADATTDGPMPPNVWPDLPGFRAATLALYDALEGVGLRLLGAIARHLDLPAGHFDGAVRGGNSILRLLHYPPAPGGAVRAGAHEDINVITLLLGAEEAGLEMLDRQGRWLPVTPPPGALAVNVGDMLQRVTGGRMRSTTHRVAGPAEGRAHASRYSMPFFLHFRPEVVVDPGPPPVTAQDYLMERLREIGLA